MKKDEIKSKELKRILEAKFDVFDFKDIQDEKLETVDSLSLRRKKLNGIETDIDLSEIFNFRKLKHLKLNGFKLSNEDVRMITNMNLETLVLNSCAFENTGDVNLTELESLTISGGEKVENVTIKTPKLLIIEGINLDFSKINIGKTKKISMLDCEIKNMDSALEKYNELEYLNLDGSKITDTNGKSLNSTNDINVGENVNISFEETYIKTGLKN